MIAFLAIVAEKADDDESWALYNGDEVVRQAKDVFKARFGEVKRKVVV
jgi:hypothetical protein